MTYLKLQFMDDVDGEFAALQHFGLNQILPFYDGDALNALRDFEQAVYRSTR